MRGCCRVPLRLGSLVLLVFDVYGRHEIQRGLSPDGGFSSSSAVRLCDLLDKPLNGVPDLFTVSNILCQE